MMIETDWSPCATTLDYMGPARVVETAASHAEVVLPEGRRVHARLAFALPYEPAPGDELLVIARGESCFAIGVLRGAGRSALVIEGDVELRAAGGTLRLAGDMGVEVESPRIELRAGKLKLAAESLTQVVTRAYQRVRELLSLRSGEVHSVVDGASLSKARSTTILSEETTTVNGKQVHLG